MEFEERITKNLQATMVETMADASRIYFPKPPSSDSSNAIRPVSDIIVHPSRLRDLKAFFLDNQAQFSCPEQGVLLEHILQGKENILAILATGFGKTTLIMMVAKVYAPTKTIVVVLPLLSLHQEVHRRAQGHGLVADQWKSGNGWNRKANIVTVAIEVIQDIQFHAYVHPFIPNPSYLRNMQISPGSHPPKTTLSNCI